MIIFPAIDIKNGECVRLYRGDMNTAERVADSPLETALSFKNVGCEWVHMVDLDGAIDGKRINSDIYIEIAHKSGLKVEVGGGIRRTEDIDFYIQNGVSRVILGSVALGNPDIVKQAVKKYGDKIAVGIDARNGMVAAEGWVKTSDIDYIELAKRMEDIGVKYIIYTDIQRDGMLSGPNTEQLIRLNEAVGCDIIASGGIKSIDDIRELRNSGLYGAICGRSIYKGTLNLAEAVRECL